MPTLFTTLKNHFRLHNQHGAALMVMLVILVVGGSALLLGSLSNTALKIERDKISADSLSRAKEALIAYAVTVQISSSSAANQPRPGELPCPDNHPLGDINEGSPSTPCDSNALGRLPWKKLGLPDLRDANGERLWYALSTNFKNTNRTGTLNSDTLGTISVYSSTGTLINDATGNSGAVAIIIAPGQPLTRLDTGIMQDRSSAGYNSPINYLDISGEDNANFSDSTTNGFIQGIVNSINDEVILNDQILVITTENIMTGTQKRVAGEVRKCLDEYAIDNNGRYPWAVPINALNYNDNVNQLFGRIPDDFTFTVASTGGLGTSTGQWGICTTHNSNTPSNWWQNWRNMVFYGLSSAYKPFNPPTTSASCSVATPCLTVNPPSATADKKYVVIVAGKVFASQLPRISSNPATYLEGGNQSADQSGAYTFNQGSYSGTFNDTVVFKQ